MDRPAVEPRPAILVAQSDADGLEAARLIHAASSTGGPFVCWDSTHAPAEATGTLFVPASGAATPLAALVHAAGGGRILVAVPPDGIDRLDPELRRIAQSPITVPKSRVCGPLCELPMKDLAQLTYRDFLKRARQHLVRAYLMELLQGSSGSVTRAAQRAGVERESMHRLLKRHGIHATGFRRDADSDV